MTRNPIFIFWAVVLGLILSSAAMGDNGVRSVAERVDQHYNSLSSLEAQFVERYQGAGMRRDESGTLYLKRPGRMAWEYREPRPKTFLISGKTAWFYVAGDRQAQRYDARTLDDLRTPLAYLLGHTKLEKLFDGLSFAPDVKPAAAGDIMLRGVPKNMRERVSQVLLEITPESEIARLVIDELDGSTTEFSLNKQRVNVKVDDTKFRFVPPPGVEVVAAHDVFAQ